MTYLNFTSGVPEPCPGHLRQPGELVQQRLPGRAPALRLHPTQDHRLERHCHQHFRRERFVLDFNDFVVLS